MAQRTFADLGGWQAGHLGRAGSHHWAAELAPCLTAAAAAAAHCLPLPPHLPARPPAQVADLALDIHVDSVTAQRIRELSRAKERAVAREEYDEAKRLKAAVDRCCACPPAPGLACLRLGLHTWWWWWWGGGGKVVGGSVGAAAACVRWSGVLVGCGVSGPRLGGRAAQWTSATCGSRCPQPAAGAPASPRPHPSRARRHAHEICKAPPCTCPPPPPGRNRLKVIGQKIAQLELRKRAAVEAEDYDLAKALKVDVDKLRAAGDVGGGSAHESQPVGPGARRATNPEDVVGRVLGRAAGARGVAGGEGGAEAEALAAEYSAAGELGGEGGWLQLRLWLRLAVLCLEGGCAVPCHGLARAVLMRWKQAPRRPATAARAPAEQSAAPPPLPNLHAPNMQAWPALRLLRLPPPLGPRQTQPTRWTSCLWAAAAAAAAPLAAPTTTGQRRGEARTRRRGARWWRRRRRGRRRGAGRRRWSATSPRPPAGPLTCLLPRSWAAPAPRMRSR
jgi:hypothetical protein